MIHPGIPIWFAYYFIYSKLTQKIKKKNFRKNRFSILDILYIITVSRKNPDTMIEALRHDGTKRNFFRVFLSNSLRLKIRRFLNFGPKIENDFFLNTIFFRQKSTKNGP